MKKEEYIERANKIIKNTNSRKIMINQINTYYKVKGNSIREHKYSIGDSVYLKKHTLLHGTYKNIEGLREIVNNGLISSFFIDGRGSKYPSSVGVWNLSKDYYLKDYINFYSGGTIRYFNHFDGNKETEVISYDNMPNLMDRVKDKGYLVWGMEQTKEARFMPSLVQDKVQIGIIFKYNKELIKGDILDPNNINDRDVKAFVDKWYYDRFIEERLNKDDFFTNRESAILFGIPSNLIEGLLVGRIYEKDNKILDEIKELLPNSYICNLDGIVIRA